MKTPLHIAGSKNKLVPRIQQLITDRFDTYVEPFCGSASIFYGVCSSFKQSFLYDTSEEIIDIHNYIMNVTDKQLENDRIHSIEMWSSYKREKIESFLITLTRHCKLLFINFSRLDISLAGIKKKISIFADQVFMNQVDTITLIQLKHI